VETYHKIQTLFKRDLDGSVTGQKGKMIEGAWTTPELEYLANNRWEFTEKVDGTNIRIQFESTVTSQPTAVFFAGRSDNAVIPEPLKRYLEETFTVSRFEDAGLDSVILFGEGYGPKIQGGGKYRDDHAFVLFDVKIGKWWLKRDAVDEIADKLGIESVPVVGYGTLYDAIEIVKGRRLAVWDDDGLGYLSATRLPMASQWGDFEAEGIVARPAVPMFDRKGDRIITKIKAVDFRG